MGVSLFMREMTTTLGTTTLGTTTLGTKTMTILGIKPELRPRKVGLRQRPS